MTILRTRRSHTASRRMSASSAPLALAAAVVTSVSVVVGLAPTAGASAPPGPNAVMGYGSAAVVASGARPVGPVAAITTTPDGGGYWTVSAAGVVGAEGDAVLHGSLLGVPLAAPVVGMAATSDGGGYWLVASDGGIFAFGDAVFRGSMGGHLLAAPVVGMAATSDGDGYWLVASDGGIFSFGDAVFHGSMGGHALDEPMVGMAATADGGGYWTVASDGGIFSFGDAVFHGSMGGHALAEPMVGMAPTADGGGYWTVASDGGIFSFGDAAFAGSGTGGSLTAPAVGMVARPGGGYWVAYGQTAPASSVLGQQELLAMLGYLPLEWTPSGFLWRWPTTPAVLKRMWAPGAYTAVLRGAIVAFEAHVGLPLDGNITAAEVAALAAAAVNPAAAANPNGYTYALASEALPETLTVWHNGAVVDVTRANTGQAAAPTAQGTWPVYERLRAQIMTGTNPGGGHYADPVQWVAYFHGSDAIHYIARSSFGSPQSLGCVEVPYLPAAFIWPYLTYGTLVTVN